VRETIDRFNKSPVTTVNTTQIRCNEDPARPVAQTVTVQAGSTAGFWMDSGISHPGPLLFYMAKVPAGKTAANWDGSGAVWFKVYEDKANVAPYSISWPNNGMCSPQGWMKLTTPTDVMQAIALPRLPFPRPLPVVNI
jgi:hypothetical protein